MHAMAARAVNLKEAMEPSFKEYAAQIVKNAVALADGLLAAGFELVSGGTDNHLMLVDLRNRPFSGKRAADRLEEAGIIVNRNTIPNDPRSPFVTSGLRPGSPALTTRGMGESEMRQIAEWMSAAVKKSTGEKGRAAIRAEVKELCARFPIYPDMSYLS